MTATERAAVPTEAPSWKQISVFAIALCVGAFELGSFAYFRRVSVDFIEAANLRNVPFYRLGESISWQRQAPGALYGWWMPETNGTWSVGSTAAFEVRLIERPSDDLVLHVSAIGFLVENVLPMRDVDVRANGTLVARWQFKLGGPHAFNARIPRAAIAGDRLRVEFHFTEAPSPVELGISGDYRKLGMLVTAWRIEPGS